MPDFKSFLRKLRQVMLVVSIEPGRLVAHRCVRLGLAWRVERSERFLLEGSEPTPDAIAATLRPLVLRWALPAATPVVVVAAPLIGGILSVSAPGVRSKDRSWIDQELARQLPFAARELETGITEHHRAGRQQAEAFWLPKGWVADLKAALGRVGLRLDEILARAQVLAPLPAKKTAKPAGKSAAKVSVPKNIPAPADLHVLLEGDGEALFFHCYSDGATLRSRSLPAGDAQAAADAVLLELMALEAQGIRVSRLSLHGPLLALRGALVAVGVSQELTLIEAPLDLPAAFTAAWQRDVHGVWLVPEKKLLFANLYRTGLLIGVVGIVLSAVFSWAGSSAESENEQLEADAKRLKPRYQKVVAIEKQAVEASRLLTAMDSESNAATPLDALYRVYEALPTKAWVTRFAYRADGALVVAGRGVKTDEALARLAKETNIVEAKAGKAEDNAPADAFVLEARWQPAPAKPATPAVAGAAAAAAVPPVSAAPAVTPPPAKGGAPR